MLVSPRVHRRSCDTGKSLDDYITRRADVTASTATINGHILRCLVEYFGAGKPLADITMADAA